MCGRAELCWAVLMKLYTDPHKLFYGVFGVMPCHVPCIFAACSKSFLPCWNT